MARSEGAKTVQASGLLGVSSVSVSADGKGLLFGATRAFSGAETQNFSLLRLPSPYRVVIDIPNARLASTQRVFPIGRNGIDRVELSENDSRFYKAVRAVVFVSDNQTLAQLTPTFEGSLLRLTLGAPVAMTPDQLAATMVVPPAQVSKAPAKVAKATKVKGKQAAAPLPPVLKPMASIQPPVPPVVKPSPVMEPPAAPMLTILGAPPAPGINVVDEVSFKDNRLYIKSTTGQSLRVKNRMVLTDPSRLVMDIENAVLRDRSLTNPLSGNSDDIRQIRVGQFDENTVRVVIEGMMPEQFEAIYPGSQRNLLAITPYSSTSITKLAANTPLGEVQSIDLKRDNGSTTLRLESSVPIVHRFIKKDDRVMLDLLNAASHPTNISVDQKQYPEIDKMRLEPLTEGQPNSKLAIQLADANIRVTPTLSPDGKVMELVMTRDDNAANSILSNLAGLAGAGKAPFPARIVVDAGHGGKDIGANRSGVNEKDLNLSLALMVRDALTAKGFKVYMTRSTDVFLPLPEITAITNRIKPDLFISIHHNASVNSAVHGIETYYYTPQSLALAKRVHSRKINAVGAKDNGVKQARFYVIHHTSVPAILCEVGYVSNPSERADLQTAERKQKTARAIADGVVDYLKTRVSAKAK